MNPEFLQTYAKHHLYDLGEYSEEAYEKFISECSDFLSIVKNADRVVWEEIMTMSVTKQSNLMKTILMDNSASIIPNTYSKNVAELEAYLGCSITDKLTEEMRQELCDDLNITEAELIELEEIDSDLLVEDPIEEGLSTTTKKVIIGAVTTASIAAAAAISGVNAAIIMTGVAGLYYVFKILKKNLNSMTDLMSDRKTKKSSDLIKYLLLGLSVIGVGASIALSSWLWTIAWAVFLIAAIFSTVNSGNIVMGSVDAGRGLLFSAFKFIKGHDKDFNFSKTYSAMYSLERSQLQGCIKSCGVNDERALERLHIIRLAVTDRSALDNNPTSEDAKRYISADCIFNCSMRYMVSMIAELFAALKSCVENTMQIKLRIKGDAIGELQALHLDASCEPIRTELNKIISQFNQFLDVAFKGNSAQLNHWRQSLNSQIQKVINGQHSRPVSVSYGHEVKISPVVFEF